MYHVVDDPLQMRSPAGCEDRRASESDTLGGCIDQTNTQPAEITQTVCENCGTPFESRKHGAGSPQRFCSKACRLQSFRADNVPSVSQTPSVSTPNAGRAETLTDDDERQQFDWDEDENLVFRQQRATAVYFNQYDELLIRQQQPDEVDFWGNPVDAMVFVARPFTRQFVVKLAAVCGATVTWEDV